MKASPAWGQLRQRDVMVGRRAEHSQVEALREVRVSDVVVGLGNAEQRHRLGLAARASGSTIANCARPVCP